MCLRATEETGNGLSLRLFLFFVIHMEEGRESEQIVFCLLSCKCFSVSEHLFLCGGQLLAAGALYIIMRIRTAWVNLWRKAGAKLVETTRTAIYR